MGHSRIGHLGPRHMISIILADYQWIDYPPKSIKDVVDGLLRHGISKQLVLSVLLYLVLDLGFDSDKTERFFKSQGLDASLRSYIRGCFALDHGETKQCVRHLMPRQCQRPSLRHWRELIAQFGAKNDHYSA